jgi:hypothetical protein
MSTKTLPHFSINDARDSQGLRSQMVESTAPCRVYDPGSLKAMGTAFDAASDALPHEGKGDDRIRRELALLILYLADRGETDPMRLSWLALSMMVKRGDLFDESQIAPIFRFRLIATPPLSEQPIAQFTKKGA